MECFPHEVPSLGEIHFDGVLFEEAQVEQVVVERPVRRGREIFQHG